MPREKGQWITLQKGKSVPQGFYTRSITLKIPYNICTLTEKSYTEDHIKAHNYV